MIKKLTVLYILMMCLVACQDHSTLLNKLNEAENWMDENPELALSALKTIEPSELEREAHQARYALLYSQALDKNFIDLTNDSLISIAVDYYKGTKEVRPKFLSYYYLGRIYTNANELTKAMLAYMEAEQLVDELGDDYYVGLLLREMGYIYNLYYDFPKSIHACQRAIESFTRANKPVHKVQTMFRLSTNYRNMDENESGYQILKTALVEVQELNDQSLIKSCLNNLIVACIDLERWEEATHWYQEYLKNDSKNYPTVSFYGYIARLHAKNGNFKNAFKALDEAWEKAKNRQDTIQMYYAESQVHLMNGNWEQAFRSTEKCVTNQNRIIRKSLQQPVLSTQKDFLNQELELQKYKLQTERAKQAIGIGLAVILVTLLIYWIRKKQQQRLAQIQEEKERLKENLEILQSTHEHTENLKNDLFESKMKELDKLVLVSLKEFKNEESRNRAILKLVQDIKGQFHGNKKSIAKLEKLVNEYQDNVMQHLRAEISLPDEAYYEMVCYLLANFSVSTIALLQEETTNTIYKRRERVRSLIQESSAPHKEQFLQI